MTSELGPQPAHAVVGASLGDVDLASLGPLTLRVGQRLLAEVLAVRAETDRVLLSIAGRRLEVQVPPGIRQGEVVRLVVAEVLPDRVVFRLDGAPAATPSLGSALDNAATAQRAPAQPPATVVQSAVAPVQTTLASAVATPMPRSADRLNRTPRPPGPPLEAARVLDEFELPDSPEARAVVNALVERRQALTRESIQPLRAAVVGLDGEPELNARAAVRLREDGLPLTPRAVQLARTALAPGTAAPIGVLLGELISALRTVPRPRSPNVPTSPPTLASEPAAPALSLGVSEPTARELQRVVTLFTESPEAALSEQTASRATQGAVPGPDIRPARQNARSLLIEGLDDLEPANVRAVPELRPRAGEAAPMRATMSAPRASVPSQLPPPVEPEAASSSTLPMPDPSTDDSGPPAAAIIRELIAVLHDRIELEQIRAAAVMRAESQPTLAPAGLTDAATAGQPAAPPPQLPLHPIALSIPLALAGQFATLQLVVQRDAEGNGPERDAGPPAVRASLTLHLRHLGEVGADLRLHGPQVRCRLRVPSPAVEQRLSGGLEALCARLQSGGLDVRQLEVIVTGQETSVPDASPLNLRHVAIEA